jgi:hypothetical protein
MAAGPMCRLLLSALLASSRGRGIGEPPVDLCWICSPVVIRSSNVDCVQEYYHDHFALDFFGKQLTVCMLQAARNIPLPSQLRVNHNADCTATCQSVVRERPPDAWKQRRKQGMGVGITFSVVEQGCHTSLSGTWPVKRCAFLSKPVESSDIESCLLIDRLLELTLCVARVLSTFRHLSAFAD